MTEAPARPVDHDGAPSTAALRKPVTSSRPATARRLPGLDGLRAIAVLAVVAFHLDVLVAPGGFLGVDVFFVISGFLITNLICTELLQTGGFRLGRFYRRRARRLLPSVLVLLAVIVIAANTVWRDQLATLTGGVLSSLTYVTNWWLIADHQSYFVQSGRPSMVEHLWSLAVEEQYYLVWAVLLALLTGAVAVSRGLLRNRSPRRDVDAGVDVTARMAVVIRTATALAITSTLVMACVAIAQDVPYRTGASRVYFGSDTHSMGLFLGSAGGAWWALRARRASLSSTRWVWLTDVLGALAIVLVLVQFRRVDEFAVGLYRGGFLVFDALVLAAIVCAIRTSGRLGGLLDIAPLQWVGRRSYAIYLWHWPVAVVTRPGIDISGPVWLIDLERVVLILGLAALSYRLVEVPLRTGRSDRLSLARPGATRAAACAAVVACAIGLVIAANPVDAGGTPRTSAPSAPSASRVTVPAVVHSSSPCPTGSLPVPRTGAAARRPAISAFGDSVLLGAQSRLRVATSALQVDAVEGRQAYAVLDDVLACAHVGELEPNVLIDVGDNGIISPAQLAHTLHAIGAARRVVIMTVLVPRDWQAPDNAIIRDAAARDPNVTVVAWNALAARHPGWLYSDGIHLRPAGAAAYTRLVLQALR